MTLVNNIDYALNAKMKLDQTGYDNSYVSVDNTDQEIQDELTSKKSSSKTSESKSSSDNKDDGKIGFGGWLKNAVAGVGDFFKGFVCDENGDFSLLQTAKTVGIGLLIGAATVLIPGAGTAIAIAALAMAAKDITENTVGFFTADTDAEAEAYARGMGAGVAEGALAVAGAKSTGAFGKLNKARKVVGSSTRDLYSSYKSGGSRGLTTEMRAQASEAGKGLVRAYDTVVEETPKNFKNVLNKETSHTAKVKEYDTAISKAEEAKANAKTPKARAKHQAKIDELRTAKEAYENGYNAVAEESDFATAQSKVNDLQDQLKTAKTQLEQAQEALKEAKKGKNETIIKNAKENVEVAKEQVKLAETQYTTAENTLRTRSQNGEFKVESETEINEFKEQTKAAYDELKEAREKLSKAKEDLDAKRITEDQYKAVQKEYDAKAKNYSDASDAQKAATRSNASKYFHTVATSAIDGATTPQARWLTLTYAGRNKEYVA